MLWIQSFPIMWVLLLALAIQGGRYFRLPFQDQLSKIKMLSIRSGVALLLATIAVSVLSSLFYIPLSQYITRILIAFLGFYIGLFILGLGFQLIEKFNPPVWSRSFFYIGCLMTVFTIQVIMANPVIDLESILFFLPICELIGLGFVLSLIILVKLFGKNGGSLTPFTSSNSSKLQYYREAGMSDQEIQFLRDQLAIAKPQIISIEQEFNRNAKLRTLEVRHNTIKVCQNFFKDIVDQPTRLVEASDFLYKLLPSLEDILKKYNEINSHVAKNKQTYMILEKSAATIEKICQSITDAYVNFHQKDLNDMEDELYVAHKNLSSQDTLTQEETVEDLINLGKEDLA